MKSIASLILLFLPVSLLSQTLSSSNLPIIVINTNNQPIPDDPKIMADMGIIDNGPGNRNNITDAFTGYNGKIGIETRGQSSQQFPMKSYGFELWDENGESIDQSLFGLPAESDWILYAPYNEKTLMHNFLAYTISREMGHWASNCRYVEVVINGEYRGIYVFMERIKRNSGRVSVSKIGSSDISGDAVTGGYIFSIDKDANAWFSSVRPSPGSTASIQYSYVYPKVGAFVNEQKTYLKTFVDNFEFTLNGNNFQDAQNGWRKFADEASFIDYFLVNEVSRNVDGYRISSFFHKDKDSKGGKIKAGPVWDYDLAFRNANYCNGSDTVGWAYKFNAVCPGDFWQVPFWWERFMIDTSFQNRLRCRWQSLRQTTLSNAHLNHLIDSIVTLTTEARQRHFQKWNVLGQYVWPNPEPIPANYQQEILTLKAWLDGRLRWMDMHLPNTGACATYPTNTEASFIVTVRPNPVDANGVLTIQSRMAQDVTITVFGSNGSRVYNGKRSLSAGFNTIPANSASWQSGVYILQVTNNTGESVTTKFVRQ